MELRSPLRIKRASVIASRRSVFTRSPAFRGDQRGRHDVAGEALPGQIPIQPVAAGPRLVGEQQCRGLRLEPPDQLVDVALPGADRPQRDYLDRKSTRLNSSHVKISY